MWAQLPAPLLVASWQTHVTALLPDGLPVSLADGYRRGVAPSLSS